MVLFVDMVLIFYFGWFVVKYWFVIDFDLFVKWFWVFGVCLENFFCILL